MGYRLSKGLECMSCCLRVIVHIHYWAAMTNNSQLCTMNYALWTELWTMNWIMCLYLISLETLTFAKFTLIICEYEAWHQKSAVLGHWNPKTAFFASFSIIFLSLLVFFTYFCNWFLTSRRMGGTFPWGTPYPAVAMRVHAGQRRRELASHVYAGTGREITT